VQNSLWVYSYIIRFSFTPNPLICNACWSVAYDVCYFMSFCKLTSLDQLFCNLAFLRLLLCWLICAVRICCRWASVLLLFVEVTTCSTADDCVLLLHHDERLICFMASRCHKNVRNMLLTLPSATRYEKWCTILVALLVSKTCICNKF